MKNHFKRGVFAAFILLALCNELQAQDAGLYFGYSVIPKSRWSTFTIQNKDEILFKPDFDINSMTSIEGNFAIRRIGANLGISAQVDDNFIGKIYRYGGIIGLKGFALRMQTSKISGFAKWNGETNGGYYPSSVAFDEKFTAIDLIKSFGLIYLGVGYQSYGMPLQLSLYIHDSGHSYSVRDGNPAYDVKSKGKSYNFSFGMDLLRDASVNGGAGYSKFAVYVQTFDKFGFGTTHISDEAVEMAEALNPGCTFVDTRKPFSAFVDYYASLGVRYIQDFGSTVLILGVGYDFEGLVYIPYGKSYLKVNNNEMVANINGGFINHGISVKMYISFNRNWKK